MTHFAHVVNPFQVDENSSMAQVQAITYESMRVAQNIAANWCGPGGSHQVDFVSVQYPEDHSAVPPAFEMTPDLDRDVTTVATFQRSRRLPLLRDILDRLYDAAPEADYLIYTNVDINLQPNFYVAAAALAAQGYDAFAINRRNISDVYTRVEELPLMYAEVGQQTPGYDCLIYRRELHPRFDVGDVCIGAAFVGRMLLLNMAYHAKKFRVVESANLTFHIGDDPEWVKPEYADYTDHNIREFRQMYARLNAQFGPFDPTTESFWLTRWRDRHWVDFDPHSSYLINAVPTYEVRRRQDEDVRRKAEKAANIPFSKKVSGKLRRIWRAIIGD